MMFRTSYCLWQSNDSFLKGSDKCKKFKQIHCHLEYGKKVLYTNGLIFYFITKENGIHVQITETGNLRDSFEVFEKGGGSVCICDEITYCGEAVSSTSIRRKIENGEVEAILPYSRPYSIYAVVEHGKGLGSTHGVATVNQSVPRGKVVPRVGVYVTECEIGEDVYPAVTNVGYRPTTDGENQRLNVETHIIGYHGNLYSSCLRVNFYKYIRSEQRFPSFNELKAQIEKDMACAVSYFK